MAGSNDFTGRNIQDTYQRVLQLSSSGQLADGTGSLVPLLDVTASFAVSASHEIIKEVSSSHANIADNLSIGANISVGQITASGDISASGDGIFNNLDIDGNIKLDNGSAIYSEFTNRGRVDLFSSTTKNAVNVKLYGGTTNLELQHDTGVEITGNVTASSVISASNVVFGKNSEQTLEVVMVS